MDFKFKIFFTLIIFVISTSFTLAFESPIGKILGKVIDQTSGNSIEYATVVLYNTNDSVMVTGSISDPSGSFTLDNLDYGNYYFTISFMGYKTYFSEEFEINIDKNSIDFGKIRLFDNAELLNEVEIVGNRHKIEYQIDKKVISVNQQLASSSMTAVEILESVPSIRVDIEGNVSLRGSSGLTVLIDGKPTILDASDVLSQLPASTIQNIEIITNPSAKYEPDGSGGIINIITKKSRAIGLQGMINLGTNSFGMYKGDLLLNYNMGKINLFFGAQHGNRPRLGESFNERRTTSLDTITTVLSEGEYERNGNRSEIKGGLDWNISANDQLSLEARIGKFQRLNSSTLDYTTSKSTIDDFELKEISINESERAGSYQNYTLNYQHNFSQKGHNLTAQANLSTREGTEYAENYLYKSEDSLNIGSRTTEDGPSRRIDIKLDYVYPINEKQIIESGFQLRNSLSEDLTNLSILDVETNSFVIQDKFWNNTSYERNIFAIYGIYKGEIANLGYQAGLRSEYTYRNTSTAKEAKNYLIDRWDFFPTFHLSYKLPSEDQFFASYSRRIDRPRGYYLEPFLTWSDLFNVRQGNPELLPEYIDAFEIGYLKEWKKARFSLEAYHRTQYNKVERIQSVYDEGVLLTNFENVGTDYSSGVESMLNLSIFKWWEFSLMGNLYNYSIKGERDNTDFEFSSFNWSTRLDNTLRIRKNIRFQLSGQYNGPSVTSQGKHYEYYELNSGLKVDFFSGKISSVFQVRDILGTHRHRSLSEGNGFYNYSERTTSGPIFSLSLSLKINNYQTKDKGNNGESASGEMGDEFE